MTKRLNYQVEFYDREQEKDRLVWFEGHYLKACACARRMSDKHDGSATVVAMDRDDCDNPVGEIVYVFGKRDTASGLTRVTS